MSNRNTSGEIVLDFAQGAVSLAHLELLSAAGVAMPLVISDISTGGTASVIGTGCRVVDKGDFERSETAGTISVKLEADRMGLFHGLRMPVFDL